MSGLPFTWDGDVMQPLPRLRRRYDAECVVGQVYQMVEMEPQRSKASHDQYFASLDEKWATLPEYLAQEYPSREVMRHKVLIRTGYCVQKDYICPSKAEAFRLAGWLRSDDSYVIVEVVGRVIRKYTALSQSYKSMGKRPFEKSKRDVLDYIDRELLAIEPDSPPLQPAPARERQREPAE